MFFRHRITTHILLLLVMCCIGSFISPGAGPLSFEQGQAIIAGQEALSARLTGLETAITRLNSPQPPTTVTLRNALYGIALSVALPHINAGVMNTFRYFFPDRKLERAKIIMAWEHEEDVLRTAWNRIRKQEEGKYGDERSQLISLTPLILSKKNECLAAQNTLEQQLATMQAIVEAMKQTSPEIPEYQKLAAAYKKMQDDHLEMELSVSRLNAAHTTLAAQQMEKLSEYLHPNLEAHTMRLAAIDTKFKQKIVDGQTLLQKTLASLTTPAPSPTDLLARLYIPPF